MSWTEPKYTPRQVNVAGKAVARFFGNEDDSQTDEEWEAVDGHLEVVNNFRVSHNYPLTIFQQNLLDSARRFETDPLVAQRIKRLSSIWRKLIAHPTMRLTQMQDIGGCRAVLESVERVRKLVKHYSEKSRIKHKPLPRDDYIEQPKASGYRGVHLIYHYVSDKKATYNGLKIEMQIRTRYQHAWATAVETVGTFVGQALKSSLGDDDWLRFFALMGSVIAMREKTPLVPNTPVKRRDLISEVAYYEERLEVIRSLEQYANALTYMKRNVEQAHWYVLELNPKEGALLIEGFPSDELHFAEEAYEQAERRTRRNGTDAVLVSVHSVSTLERAYPNYFADTNMFLDLLTQALSGRSRGIERKRLRATETSPAQSQQLTLFR